jgi:hypothetical protein
MIVNELQNKKTLVIVCALFYPTKHIAAFRLNSIVKYWDQDNYDVKVYTYGESSSLFEYYGASVQTIKGSNLYRIRKQQAKMSKWKHNLYSLNNKLIRFFSKEDYPGWRSNVIELIRKENSKIDVLLTSFSPVDSHLIGLELKKSYNDLFWIADMRDEMSQNQMLSVRERDYYYKIESKVLANANLITAVSAPIVDGFKINSNKVKCDFLEVRNGYDHDIEPKEIKGEVFTFIYAGTFYGNRKPNTFFEALVSLQKDGKLPIKWQILFIGTPKNFEIPQSIESNVQFVDQMDNIEVINKLCVADCQLLIHPPSAAKGIFTGKLFDYLSVKRPILALVDPNDVAASLINAYKSGFVCDFFSIEEIKSGILNSILVWKGEMKMDYENVEIKLLHRRKQVETLYSFVSERINDKSNE